MKQLFILITLIGIVFMSSCKKDEIEPTPEVKPTIFELKLRIATGESVDIIISQEGHGNVVVESIYESNFTKAFELYTDVPAHIRVTFNFNKTNYQAWPYRVEAIESNNVRYSFRDEVHRSSIGIITKEVLFEIDYNNLRANFE